MDQDIEGEVTRGARAIVVCPDIRRERRNDDPEARLAEARGLAEAIGIVVAEASIVPVRTVRAATLFGEGQIERIATECEQEQAELVIVDGALSAIQQRNLEEKLKRKVIDRTGLILEIFGERAATAEGRLQVELAHLDYQAGRLVRSWTHLERQRGGFGFLGGPGETQIEADRRQIRDRMARIRRELGQVSRTRGLHRGRRQRAPWPVIALVGYTNAGKSTLFNRMTQASVMAEDLLFATLDPTMRNVKIPGFDRAILSDTVGFVSNLPTELVAAFRATLEEVAASDLILHVRDIAHPDSDAQAADVEAVLSSLGLAEEDSPPRIEVWNKLDLLPPAERQELIGEAERRSDVAAVSALTGEGVDGLRETISHLLHSGSQTHQVRLNAGDGERIAWLHARGEILEQRHDGDQLQLSVKLSPENWARFEQL